MRQQITLSRRTLVAAACGGGAVWLGTTVGFPASRSHHFERVALATLCLRLGCSQPFGEACCKALPPAERSARALARILTADLRTASGEHFPTDELPRAIRQRTGDDFRAGRVVPVDGWILSLTEIRLYALAALTSPRNHKHQRTTA